VKTRSPDDIPIPEIAVKRGDQFLALAQGLVEGFVGLLHYMAFIASAELAFAKLAIHGHDLLGDDEPERAFHDNSRRHFESLSRRLILVHSITLVDAFISDLTTLLLISHPQTIAKDAEIKLGELLKLSSIDEAVTDMIKRRVRAISSESIRKRIRYLKTHFASAIHITDEQYSALETYTEARNGAIHNWGPWELRWSPRGPVLEGIVGSSTKFEITKDFAQDALSNLMLFAASIIDGTALVFSIDDDPRLLHIISWLKKDSTSTQSA